MKGWIWLVALAPCLAVPVAQASPAPIATSTPARAQRVEVEWQGSWWPAVVVRTRGTMTRVHYVGWGPEWDEWAPPSRVRSAAVRPPLHNPSRGQRVEVEWHGSWWPGEVLHSRAGLTKIHYLGWGPEWDEWVEAPRLRAPHPSTQR